MLTKMHEKIKKVTILHHWVTGYCTVVVIGKVYSDFIHGEILDYLWHRIDEY